MKVCVIGGTGQIGKFLVPFLVKDGHDVTVVTTGRTRFPDDPAWEHVELKQALYRPDDNAWSGPGAALQGDVVIDILGHNLRATYNIVRTSCRHIIVCGSLWMLGPPKIVPTPEITQGPCEFAFYAKRYDDILTTKEAASRDGIAFTAILPSNICGPGKIPIDGYAGRSVLAHKAHMEGKPVSLPGGCNTLISPCDASDIAQVFRLAVGNRAAADGELFNAGPAYALTARRFIETYGEIYNSDIPVEWVTWKPFLEEIMPDPGANYHFREHMVPDISKARSKLGYQPQYTPEEAMERAVAWMRRENLI